MIKSRLSIAITIGIVGISDLINRKPSTADETEMGGVIKPSANNVLPPIIAGKISHHFVLRTRVYKEKIPPSPLLSARSVIITYFNVVRIVNVQNTQLNAPKINCSVIGLSPIIAFNTYNGEVPISP